MSVGVFFDKCMFGDESEAKFMVERDPGLHNKQGCGGDSVLMDSNGYTGLMVALQFERHSLSLWLLSLPGLELSLC